MWRIAVMCVTTAVGYAVGSNWESAWIGAGIGFAVGIVISFPRIIGEVVEGAFDCID